MLIMEMCREDWSKLLFFLVDKDYLGQDINKPHRIEVVHNNQNRPLEDQIMVRLTKRTY